MSTRGRAVGRGLLLVLLVATLSGLWFWGRSSWARRRPIAVVTGLPANGSHALWYQWLSSDTAMVFQETGPNRRRSALCHDLRTARTSPAPFLVPSNVHPLSVSPDGAWLVSTKISLPGYNPSGRARTTIVASARGGAARPRVWTVDGAVGLSGVVAWLPDKQGWVTDCVSLYGQQEQQFLTFLLDDSAPPKPPAVFRGQPVVERLILGVARPGRRLLLADIEQTGRRAKAGSTNWATSEGLRYDRAIPFFALVAYDLDANGRLISTSAAAARPPHVFWVPVPLHSRRMQCALSPGGDRLAWIVVTPTRSPPFLARALALLHVPLGEQASVWVGDLDGSAPRQVACIGLKQNEPIPAQLAWTPDNKRLSYLHDGALWTVPVR